HVRTALHRRRDGDPFDSRCQMAAAGPRPSKGVRAQAAEERSRRAWERGLRDARAEPSPHMRAGARSTRRRANETAGARMIASLLDEFRACSRNGTRRHVEQLRGILLQRQDRLECERHLSGSMAQIDQHATAYDRIRDQAQYTSTITWRPPSKVPSALVS